MIIDGKMVIIWPSSEQELKKEGFNGLCSFFILLSTACYSFSSKKQYARLTILYCSASINNVVVLNYDFSQYSIFCRAPRACPCSTLRFTERTVPWTAYSWRSWRTSWGPDSCPRLNSCWTGRWLTRYSQHTLCTHRSNDLCIYALRIMGSHFFQATFTIHVHDRWWSEKVKLEFSTCFIKMCFASIEHIKL